MGHQQRRLGQQIISAGICLGLTNLSLIISLSLYTYTMVEGKKGILHCGCQPCHRWSSMRVYWLDIPSSRRGNYMLWRWLVRNIWEKVAI